MGFSVLNTICRKGVVFLRTNYSDSVGGGRGEAALPTVGVLSCSFSLGSMEMGPRHAAAPAGVSLQQPSAAGASNNLAMVVDKRPPHRPGGCIGIFFQLLDWNRRLAKKRFFSRKFLPQGKVHHLRRHFMLPPFVTR